MERRAFNALLLKFGTNYTLRLDQKKDEFYGAIRALCSRCVIIIYRNSPAECSVQSKEEENVVTYSTSVAVTFGSSIILALATLHA